MKHFTAEELFEIAAEEYKMAGIDIEGEGAWQWAYWSAENDDFHSEHEAREELRRLLAKEKAMMG